VIHPFAPSIGTFSAPAAEKTASIETKKNLVNQVACSGAYPSCRIFLAVLLQKFPVMVINNQVWNSI
jgi:hypothetical protein